MFPPLLPRLIGRGRALEVLLGCNDFSAELAERYGYINRALPADELTPFVEKLARRIASFPAHAIAHAEAAVDRGAFSSMAEGLLVEAHESLYASHLKRFWSKGRYLAVFVALAGIAIKAHVGKMHLECLPL
jgi:enoyl-CoA hydratase/carnithine racemase